MGGGLSNLLLSRGQHCTYRSVSGIKSSAPGEKNRQVQSYPLHEAALKVLPCSACRQKGQYVRFYSRERSWFESSPLFSFLMFVPNVFCVCPNESFKKIMASFT